MIRKLIAIDLIPMEYVAKSIGLPYLPVSDLIHWCQQDGTVDIIETLIPLVKKPITGFSEGDYEKYLYNFDSKKYALQTAGAKILTCHTKPTSIQNGVCTGYKQVDDHMLMLHMLHIAMKYKVDYVVLFAADGDFAPLIELLRNEGIRTELVTPMYMVASDMRRYATKIIDYVDLLKSLPIFKTIENSENITTTITTTTKYY